MYSAEFNNFNKLINMKKILFLCFSVLYTNFIWSQVTVSAPSSVEVGQNNTFSFVFLPSSNIPQGSTSYILTSRFINCSNSNMNNTGSNSYADNSQALNEYGLNQSQGVSFPIKWGDNSNNLSEIISIITNVSFYKIVDNVRVPNGTYTYIDSYTVNINRIFTPTISSPTILSCCTSPVTFTASNYGTANVFNWMVSGGTYTGSGSSISVSPSAGSGAVSVSCVVSRSTGLSSYTRSNSVTVSRTARTASFTGVYSTVPPYDYICKGSGGRQMTMPTQCGFSSVNWVAPNCTITGQGTLTPTITPSTSIPTGNTINIYAVVTFIGGCTATTPSIPFKILDSTTAPLPAGNFTVTPNTGNVCTAEIFELTFNSTNGFNNGVTTFSPTFLWGPGDPLHYKVNKPTTVTVCNKNLCTGLSTCKSFTVYPPALCSTSNRMASTNLDAKLVIAPNPTEGNIIVTLPETISGIYQVFDQTNTALVQEAKFDNQSELQIQLSQKLRAGIYILKVISENNTFTEKIILTK